MSHNDLFRAIVGLMVLASVALTLLISPWFLLFTTFIGVNLFQSAFTHFCPLDMILRRACRTDQKAARQVT